MKQKHIVEVRRYTGSYYEDGTPECEILEQHRTEYPSRYYAKYINEWAGTVAIRNMEFYIDGVEYYEYCKEHGYVI